MRRFPTFVALACALFAISIPAFGQSGPGGGSPGGGTLPACQQGQQPTQQNPCRPAQQGSGQQGGGGQPCGQGQAPGGQGQAPGGQGQAPGGRTRALHARQGGQQGGPSQGNPPQGGGQQGGQGNAQGCGGQGQGQGANQGQGNGQGQGGGQGQQGDAGGDDTPSLKTSFLNKVWRFNADADSYDADANVLNCTITKILNLPKKFEDQDDDIVDADAYVLFSKTTRVYDQDGKRLSSESKYDGKLDDAETVKVVGKVVRPDKWQDDEDGSPTPTIRAKKVYITG